MRSFLILFPLAAHLATAQTVLGTHPNLMNGDMAVLEGGEQRKDIACTVTPEKPLLGFDLKFHTGYDLDLPMRELVGPRNTLSILFRVTAKNGTGEPVYLNQTFRVPAITDDQGHVALEGAFDVGQGPYHVDWLMHDFAGRFCSSY